MANMKGKLHHSKMVTRADLLHVYLKPNKMIKIAGQEMAFVYGLEGSSTSAGEIIKSRTSLIIHLRGKNAVIKADKNGLEFMFGSATPINEPIIYRGPFVATTPEQVAEIQRRYWSH